MKKRRSFYPAFVILVFALFMLLHQTDKLMIGSLQVPISRTFGLNDLTWGFINSGAMIVATLLYPIWGYLYDRYARAKLLALASFIWGATTWLSSIVKTYPAFLATRSSTGIDDSSYPGLYSLVGDYFGPKMRGKVYGILNLTSPIGYLVGMVLALMVAPSLDGKIFGLEGWRSIFLITGSLGILMAIVIFFGIKEVPRGKAEPEFESMEEVKQFRFSWKEVREALKKRTMWFVFLQGFAGVFPWNVITVFFFKYLMRERGYDNTSVLMTMGPVILILAAGYFVGGALGDWLFKRTPKGRILVSSAGVILGAIFLFFALNTPVTDPTRFFILMCLTAIFMPFSSPNVLATIFDITAPEVRSTTQAAEYFVENSGAALAPTLAGALSLSFASIVGPFASLQYAILTVCITAWVLCFFLYLGALFFVDRDVKSLRDQMAARAAAQGKSGVKERAGLAPALLFMISIQIDLSDRAQVHEFLDLPFRLYRGTPQWVPPLRMDDRLRLDPQRYPFYRHSNAAFFLVRHNARTVGRLAVLDPFLFNEHNHEQTAFFYLFECEDDPGAASELFAAGFDWARARGLNRVLGPKGFTALDGLGLLVKGFERRPALGLPYNPPYYPALVEAQGFEKFADIVSGYLGANIQFPERIHELADRVRERRGLRIARFHSRRELRSALKHLKALYNGALEGTSGGTPITDEEIKALADQMLWFADPELIKIVMKDERPVGFLLAYPDISAALQKTQGRIFPFGWLVILRELHTTDWININGAGMIEEFRGLGGTAILYSELFKSVTGNPRYRHAEVVQIGLENDKMQREMENFGVDFYKMHRVYRKNL